MIKDRNKNIPLISSIDEKTNRPFWSVMIPTYNCANYLIETLESVLVQDPGAAEMQIEIVDDCSTKDDPEAVVHKIGQGRVSFFRKPQNGGATNNFNTCIERAKGQWVHILHGDDTVLPGFYSRLRAGIEQDSTIGAAITRYMHIDKNSNWRVLSYLERDTPGILEDFLPKLFILNRIMTPSIVVKRSVYEQLGGFNLELIHSADWEMWRRITVHYPIWFEPSPLACYREHAASDTSHLRSTGANITDGCKSIDIAELYLPDSIGPELSNLARETHAILGLETAMNMLATGNMSATVNLIRAALKCYKSPKVFGTFASLLANSQDLLELTAKLFISTDTSQILADYGVNGEATIQVEFDIREINLIAFPDWQSQEEFLYEDLTNLFRIILTSPQRDKISLLIDNSNLADEDVSLIISDVIFNLVQQENLDIEEEPAVCLLNNLNEQQWKFVLDQAHVRVVLQNQNKEIITKIGADELFSLQLSELAIYLRNRE